jgi:uncharacterized protein YceH (UPF0502 family)
VDIAAHTATTSAASAAPATSATAERITALEAEVAALRATVQRLCDELGISANPATE